MLNLYGIKALADKAPLLLRYLAGSFFFSNLLHSYSAPEAEGLPLNTSSKGIVDQVCLINNVGYDENLKCAGSWPYFVCLIL